MIMRSYTYSKITAAVIPTVFETPSTQSKEGNTVLTPSLDHSASAALRGVSYNIYKPQVSIVTKPGADLDYQIEYIPQIDIIDKNLPYQVIIDNADKYIASIDRNVFEVSKDFISDANSERIDLVIADPFTTSFFDLRDNTKAVALNSDVLMFVNEYVEVTRNGKTARLTVLPISYTEYSRLMSKPYKRPIKNQAWRLLDNSGGQKKAEIIIGPNDTIKKYVIRYVKRPRAIRLTTFDDITIDGGNTAQCCELDPILFPEII